MLRIWQLSTLIVWGKSMRKIMSRQYIISISIIVVCWLLISSFTMARNLSENQPDDISSIVNGGRFGQIEVWVDDDYYDGGYNDGHTWGYDAFDNIQDGINNVSDNGIVHVYNGTYDVFRIQGRSNIQVAAENDVIVEGSQQAWDATLDVPAMVNCVVFVNNSFDIYLSGFEIQGDGLSGRSYAVYYNGSTGVISYCTVSPNERGNMNSIGIRAHWNSTVNINNCTVENYGRIAIYCRTGAVLGIYDNTLIGPLYLDGEGDYVSYGIEVEDLEYASHATIRYNEIYNHDHTGTPTWSSAGIIIDAWRYYEVTTENCSALIEYNNIHDNMMGVQIIPNDNIHVNRNEISDNTGYGAVSDPYWDGEGYVDYDLDALNNWWGDSTGPYHPDENPEGLGDNITDNVVHGPWVETVLPKINLTKPLDWFLYITIGDFFELKIPMITNIIIGKINIEAETKNSLHGVDRVEFYIDEELMSTDFTEPYSWLWDERQMFFLYTIKVVAYDSIGNSEYDDIQVWKLF